VDDFENEKLKILLEKGQQINVRKIWNWNTCFQFNQLISLPISLIGYMNFSYYLYVSLIKLICPGNTFKITKLLKTVFFFKFDCSPLNHTFTIWLKFEIENVLIYNIPSFKLWSTNAFTFTLIKILEFLLLYCLRFLGFLPLKHHWSSRIPSEEEIWST